MASNPRCSDCNTVFLGSKGFELTTDLPSKNYPPPLAAAQPREERLLKSRGRKTEAGSVTPGASQSSGRDRSSSAEFLIVTARDPLMFYKKRYQVGLDTTVGVYQKITTKEYFDIRTISGPGALRKLRMLSNIHHENHENLLHVYEIFDFGGVFYTVFEHMELSCEHFISCYESLGEENLATVLCQVGAI
jgi:hypothetical protein